MQSRTAFALTLNIGFTRAGSAPLSDLEEEAEVSEGQAEVDRIMACLPNQVGAHT